jgi:translation initiation factor IF-3
MNHQIPSTELRIIDNDGQQVGIMSRDEAVQMARAKFLDLVLIVPDAKPPVCRIMDIGKFRYEQEKKDREARKKQKPATVIKELKFTPKIDEHDFQIRVLHAKEFLEKGHKVKLSLRFRGREATHPEIGREILARCTKILEDMSAAEGPLRQEGRSITMVLAPVRKPKGAPKT